MERVNLQTKKIKKEKKKVINGMYKPIIFCYHLMIIIKKTDREYEKIFTPPQKYKT